MGGKTREKQEKAALAEAQFQQRFVMANRAAKQAQMVKPKPLVEDIETYRPHFIRDEKNFNLKTKSDNRTKQLLELVRHVFHHYQVPSFMTEVWEQPVKNNGVFQARNLNNQFDFKMWYICIATGGSLYKEYAKEHLTKKEVHTFLNCPFALSIRQVLVFAVAKSAGATDGIALRIAKSKIQEQPFNEFWRHNIRFFAGECPNTVNEINDLTDYLIAKKAEAANFTLAGTGYTLKSLTKKMVDWHYDLRRLKAIGDAKWEGHPIEDKMYEREDEWGNKVYWSFKQIKTAKELQQEGNAQRHCVYGYKSGCIRGDHSIWSLSYKDGFGSMSRKITIELRNDGTIAQARGLANRSPRPNEMNMIKIWAKENNFYIGSYY